MINWNFLLAYIALHLIYLILDGGGEKNVTW